MESKAPLEKEIREVCQEMAGFLIGKNKAYGNSAAEPVAIFAKRLDTLAQIDVRIDDKLSRLQKGQEYPGDDTIKDLAGYLLLRMVVGKKDPQPNGKFNGTCHYCQNPIPAPEGYATLGGNIFCSTACLVSGEKIAEKQAAEREAKDGKS